MLEELVNFLQERLKQPLPGAKAHDMMRATPVGPLKPNFTHKIPPKPGAVLIALYERDGVIQFPLTKRAEYLGAHSAQVSLPGGKSEPGEDAVMTALREAREEIGLDDSKVNIIGQLSDFFVIPSNFLVRPIIGYLKEIPSFNPDPREVARILIGDLYGLTRQDAIKNKEILAAGQFRMMAPHFEIENEIVWGATAMMLNEFCHIIQEMKSD